MRFQGQNVIMIERLRYIGDVLITTPFVKAMRRAFPKARIIMMVNKGTEEVLENNTDIDEVLVWDRDMGRMAQLAFVRELRRKDIETVIDLTNSDRSAWIARSSGAATRIGFQSDNKFRNKRLYNMLIDVPQSIHQVDRGLEIAKRFGCRRFEKKPVLIVTEAETQRAAEIMGGIEGRYVVIHPGARRWYKSWPTDRFAELADEIAALGLKVVVAGGPTDVEAAEKIVSHMKRDVVNIAGKTTIRELAAVLKGAVLFVGNDSAPMHMAYSVDTPTIALFGPTDWQVWHPIGTEHMVFSHDVECSPCGHSKDCDKGDQNCMKLITVEEVFEGVREILEGSTES